MNLKYFMEQLIGLQIENTFNPYSDQCPMYDLDNAPQRRSETLLAILNKASEQEVDSLWIGRDLGHRGGRRTGLPLTDDVRFDMHTKRWGLSVERPTKGKQFAERTAATVWAVLSQIDATVLLWNIFPLHPYEPGHPLSNRPHNLVEREIGEVFLSELLLLIQPRRLIAIGNDAFSTASRLYSRNQVVQVRHPSYGGQIQFLRGMQELYPSLVNK